MGNLNRKRLEEFGDLNGVPQLYNYYLRIYLVVFYKLIGYHKLWIPALKKLLARTHKKTILEYGSGSGDALLLLSQELQEESQEFHFLLSDITPLPEFTQKINSQNLPHIRYIESSVNATQPGQWGDLPGVFINSFHHFNPEQAQNILKTAILNKGEILILEYTRNTLLAMILMFFGQPVILLSLPFVVRLKDLPLMVLFTYLIPLFPLMFLWDGLVSCWRTYSPKEIENLVKNVDDSHSVQVKSYAKGSLLYPAGATAIWLSYENESPTMTSSGNS